MERIAQHRKGVRGRLEFQVFWEGSEDVTWEPRKNLGNNIVLREYLSANNMK